MNKTVKTITGILAGATLAGTGVVVTDQIINPYTTIGNTLQIEASSSIPEAGTEKIIVEKTEPKVTLTKFNGEVGMGIKYQGMSLATTGNRPLFSKNVEWTDGEIKMEAVPLDATTTMEDGGIEINIILNSKPASNVFTFQLDNWENLDFLYQPPLTNEEIKEGANRQDNVVGSYAVYYKNHANHKMGETNYATGKAYHIFRPLISDNKGNTTWVDLSYSNGVLSVTVPQSFLDSASYPVKVDPTFGYTTQGGTQIVLTGKNTVLLCSIVGNYIASSGDIITNYSIWGVNAIGRTLDFASFSVVGGVVTNQLDTKIGLVLSTSVDALVTSSSFSHSTVAGTQYGVAISGEDYVDNSGPTIDFDAGSVPGRFNSTLTVFPGVGGSFSPTGTDSGRHYSLYATYTNSTVSSNPKINVLKSQVNILQGKLIIP